MQQIAVLHELLFTARPPNEAQVDDVVQIPISELSERQDEPCITGLTTTTLGAEETGIGI